MRKGNGNIRAKSLRLLTRHIKRYPERRLLTLNSLWEYFIVKEEKWQPRFILNLFVADVERKIQEKELRLPTPLSDGRGLRLPGVDQELVGHEQRNALRGFYALLVPKKQKDF